MAIRINLLAEAQAEEELRRRDPVKRSVLGGSLLIACFLVWFSSIWATTLWSSRQLTAIETEIQTRTNDFGQVLANQRKAADASRRIESLQKLSAARFLHGTLLESLQKVYVPNVQITRLRIDQSYASTPGSPPVTNSFGVLPGRPGTATERVLMTIDARDSSSNPGDQINHFKEALSTQENLKILLDKTNNAVRLSAPPSAPQSISDGKFFVIFTLESRFADKSR
jgi:hypothetical protein